MDEWNIEYSNCTLTNYHTIKEEFCLFGFGQIFIKEMVLGGRGGR
jgi:hypothetical protein